VIYKNDGLFLIGRASVLSLANQLLYDTIFICCVTFVYVYVFAEIYAKTKYIFRPKLVDGMVLLNCNSSSSGWLEWAYHKMNMKVSQLLNISPVQIRTNVAQKGAA
jgi:hypothetical protein